MTCMLRRTGALALALLTLPACDSGNSGSSTPGALVGSWTLQENVVETFLTVNQAQVIVDRSGPTTGTLQISGAQTGTLRFMNVDPVYGQVQLTSYDPSGSSYPADRIEARLALNGYSTVTFSSDTGAYTQYDTYDATPYTYADGRLTVRPITLRSYTGATITIAGGTLSYQTTPIAAGERVRARRVVVPFQNSYDGLTAIRYVLEDGGGYRAERDFSPNLTRSVAGTWEADGSTLRLSTTYEQTTETQTFRYEVSSETLRLGVIEAGCLQDTNCLRYQEQSFGLRAGTLTEIEVETTGSFERTVLEGRAAAPRPAAHVPAGLDARREATIWPRALAQPASDQ